MPFASSLGVARPRGRYCDDDMSDDVSVQFCFFFGDVLCDECVLKEVLRRENQGLKVYPVNES